MTDNAKQLTALIACGMTEDEAREVLEADREIDKGAKLFELSAELEAGAKKARRADRKTPTAPVKRERKPDNDKREIISVLDDALCDICDNVEVKNAEREIVVLFNDRKFKITLSAPRS